MLISMKLMIFDYDVYFIVYFFRRGLKDQFNFINPKRSAIWGWVCIVAQATYPMIDSTILRRSVCKTPKVLLSCIGHSGSNCSAFYLYRATNVGLSSTPCFMRAQASKGCGLCTVESVPCNIFSFIMFCFPCLQSYGGYLTAHVMGNESDTFSCGIIGAALSDRRQYGQLNLAHLHHMLKSMHHFQCVIQLIHKIVT